MKKLLVGLVLIFSVGRVTAQYSGLTFGLRTHTKGLTEFNQILAHYEDTRPWLDKKLGKHNFQNGFEVGLALGSEKMGINYFRYFRVWHKSSVSGTTPSGEEFTRKIKTRMGGIEIADVWYTPINLSKMNIGFGVMPLGAARIRIHTKINEEDWEKIRLSNLDKEKGSGYEIPWHSYSSVHIDLTSPHFHAQLFYAQTWYRDNYDLLFFNAKINPSSFTALNKRTRLKPAHWAFKFVYII